MKKNPPNWETTFLSNVANIEMGQSPDSRSYNEQGIGLPFFQGKAEFGKLYPTVRKWCSEPIKIAEPNDILLSVRAPVGPTNLAKEKSCIGRGLAAIRASKFMNQRFIFHYFKSIEPWLMDQGTGTTFRAISGTFIQKINIPIPPASEQKRIAYKLDSLLAQVDACRDHLERAQEIIKQFRQAVLSQAMSGELTTKWRIENSKSIDDWSSVSFFDFVVLQRGYDLVLKNLENGQYPVVTSAGISAFYSKYMAKGPGVIAGRSGSVGKVYYVEEDFWPHNTSLYVKNFNGNIPKYVYYFLSNFDIRKYSASTAVPTLNRNNLRDVAVKVPPVDEQNEIVRQVEILLNYANRLESLMQNINDKVDSLTPALLAKAFCGKLVPQDPNDEPASVLLERIKAERASVPKVTKKPRRRTGMDGSQFGKKVGPISVVLALQETNRQLSTAQLFQAAGYPSEAESEKVEDFFVDLRDAINNNQVKKVRLNNEDWFSLV